MKSLGILVFLLACSNTQAVTIQKWTDDSGQIHYGDSPPATTSQITEELLIEDSFDPEAYDQAQLRNSILDTEVKKIEAREKATFKRAEKRLDEYFKDLDRNDRDLEREKATRQRSRNAERHRSSIKLKRGSASPPNNKTGSTYRRKP